MSTSDETHKVENWSEYNDALVDRGRLTVWLSEDAIEGWKDQSPPQQGAQWIFTDLAIQTCLQIKVVYGLGLRETEGFVASLFELMGLEKLPVPDYTTLSKRQGDLDVDLSGGDGGSGAEPTKEEEATAEGESMHLVIDSTGLKVYGEGEWKQRIHGKQKRRTWRKLHLGVDSGTGLVKAATLTDNTSGDGSQVEPLLEETLSGTSGTDPSDAEAEDAEAEDAEAEDAEAEDAEAEDAEAEDAEAEDTEAENTEAEDTVLDTVGADGAYDTWDVYGVISDYGATPVIPPQKNAKIKKHGNCSGPPLPRDEAIRYIRGHGRKKWKRASGYHRRSLAETAVYRFKQLMGRFVEARKWENERTEVRLKAKALNKMTRLGMPETSKTAV
jgi:hypothetical protein